MSFCSEAMNPARSLDESCLKGNKHKTFQTDYPRIRLFQTSQHQSITPSHHHTITPSNHQIIKRFFLAQKLVKNDKARRAARSKNYFFYHNFIYGIFAG